jgi:Tfp pilus assembly protein PilF
LHIFNLNNKPHLILTDKELLFRDNPLDDEMRRHLFENIKKLSLIHRYDANKELFIWLQITMHDQPTPFLVQLSALDKPIEEVIETLRPALETKVKLYFPSNSWLKDVKSDYKTRKFLILSAAVLILSLFLFHKFIPPELNSLKTDSLKAAYQKNNSLCSAKAKVAYKDSAEEMLLIKSYCGVFGSWKEEGSKRISAQYLETEFSELKASDYILQAGKYIKSQDYTSAITSLNNALYLEPKNDHAYTLLGFSHYLNGEKKLAMQSTQKALSLNPDSAEAHNAIGLLYKEEKQNDKAYQHFQKSALLKPDAKSYRTLAEMELLLDKPAQARQHFEKSLYEDQNNTAVLTQLGLLYWKEHAYTKAAETLQTAYRIDPSNPGLFLNFYEISMVTSTSLSTQDQDAFRRTFKDDKSKMMTLDMLRIIKRSIQQEEVLPSLKKWEEEYSGEKLDWSFREILSWLDERPLNDEEKDNIKKTIGFFIGYQQLYNLEHQESVQ